MKRLLFLLLFIPVLGKGQCMGDSLISATKDSLYVGDTLTVNVYYDVTAGSVPADSIFLVMDYISHGTIEPYLHDYTDVVTAYHPNTYGNLVSKISITSQYADTSWTKIYLYTTQNNSCGASININRQYIYVKDTTHPNGINEITASIHRIIKEVRYYTITGQLYGAYSQKQNHLPNIPLIEEVIYTDNNISIRRLIEL